MTQKPTTIEAYIKDAPLPSQEKLRELYTLLKTTLPHASEAIKWGMPAFSSTRILVCFAGYKHHIGFYPTTSPIVAFKKELAPYKTAKGSIQFPLDKPLPVTLIKKITKLREKENKEHDALWKSNTLSLKKTLR